MNSRFIPPDIGAPSAVRFPAIERQTLDTGLSVWAIPHRALPVFTAALVLPFGSAQDPASSPGLAGVLGALLNEGAGDRHALDLAAAFAALGTELTVDVGSDVTTVSFTALTKFFEPALDLLFDVVARPRLDAEDFARVVEIRLNRLRQMRSSASAMADRAFLRGVFGPHSYGHGVIGTAESLSALTVEDVRAFHAAHVHPLGTTCVVAGDLNGADVHALVARHAERWASTRPVHAEVIATPLPQEPRVLVVDRPGAPQTEVRVGHLGPTRHVDEYYALVVMNAVLGGQFTSRINLNLREARGLTYGAHTSLDFRAASGLFLCDTAVQADATALVVSEILAEFEAIGSSRPAEGDELSRSKASLTRGYVRQFETPAQLAIAACRLTTYGLPDDTFARFVPSVAAIESADVTAAARKYVRPPQAIVALVGDAALWESQLAQLGRPVERVEV